MRIFNATEPFLLFVGDIVCFVASLWLALLARTGEVPTGEEFFAHLVPFAYLFVVWCGVFFIAGLYEKHTAGFRFRLPGVLLRAQVINTLLAAVFFYSIPIFGVAPKTVLFVYLIVSFAIVLLWRLYGERVLVIQRQERALIIGTGKEMHAVRDEIVANNRYGLMIVGVLDYTELSPEALRERLAAYADERVSVVVVDMEHPSALAVLPSLYLLLFRGVRHMDLAKVYEDMFDRVPLSAVSQRTFLEMLSKRPHASYDLLKRVSDILLATALGLLSLIAYPFVIVAMVFEDGRPFFLIQERVGRGGRPIRIVKFRSMTVIDNGLSAENKAQKITRVGKIIRRLRIDELPQLWNVLRGDLSLIGPRPELPAIAETYEREIPYYGIRHTITPGLSGWAQIYHDEAPKFGVAVDQTKDKLSYDLYYIKNRSFLLDLKITLKTIKTLLSRSGV